MDLSFLSEINDPFSGMAFIFVNGGWIVFAILGLWMIKEAFLMWRQGIFEANTEYILLAIDVPKENEQSPKAVEQFFDHLTGFDKTPTLQEKYIEGFLPTKVSLELVSIGGYVQFLAHCPVKFRDLVEAALYAEYPDAEITEVEDYVNGVPKPDDWVKNWPENMDMNMWGSEIAFYNKNPYPIRTWMEFEHGLSRELKDPMANILEMLSRLSPDEQVWIQWVVQTADRQNWPSEAHALVRKLIGESEKKKTTSFLDIPQQVIQGSVESITASIIEPTDFATTESQTNTLRNNLLNLTPGQIGIVQSIERKAAKAAFKVRGRMIYFGKKEVFSKARGVSGVYGTLKQFNTNNMNGFSPPPKSKTEAWYILPKYRTKQRMRMLLSGYRSRSNWAGHKTMIMNTEELASVWHFPVITVKAQQVQKTESKKNFAPSGLPINTGYQEESVSETTSPPSNQPTTQNTKPAEEIPDNLPLA